MEALRQPLLIRQQPGLLRKQPVLPRATQGKSFLEAYRLGDVGRKSEIVDGLINHYILRTDNAGLRELTQIVKISDNEKQFVFERAKQILQQEIANPTSGERFEKLKRMVDIMKCCSTSPEYRAVSGRNRSREPYVFFGNPNGTGITVWSNGERYEGLFQNSLKEGQGVYTFADGRRYEGEFHNG